MPLKVIIGVLLLLCMGTAGFCQPACTTAGQTPETAFPVCGTSVFKQQNVPSCINNAVPVPGCTGDGVTYSDLNPYWYSFTCYTTGTLGFLITPNNLSDDYDWQLFDVTGQNLASVYTNSSLFVTGNWSGSSGATGASSAGTANIECASDPSVAPENTFSAMPTIIQGHQYLLLISHYTSDNQSGYSLSFSGGTGSITDPLQPAVQTVTAACDAQTLYVQFNKPITCGSLAINGSDFYLLPGGNPVASATANCNNGFDMDSATISLTKPLKPGNYTLVVKNGTDSNTLIDNCGNMIPVYDSLPLVIYPLQPTPLDSISAVQCAPGVLQLVFRNGMQCSSVAANGSDFVVTGSTPVSVIKAYGDSCSNGISNIIHVVLSKPIVTAGSYTLTLQQGTDGNTVFDECAQETPAGSFVNFATADTVSASFLYKVDLGCNYDTLFYGYNERNNVDAWNWTFDSNGTSNTEDSFFLFDDYGTKHIRLICSNGVCSDTATNDILLDNFLQSRFTLSSPNLCPEDVEAFTDSSIGKITNWYWIFGDGTTSTLQYPPEKKYPPVTNRGSKFYPVALIVKNNINCFDTAQTKIQVLYNCYIAVPTAFTPNGDGLNDYLYPLNAYKADRLEFKVYNRYGQLVFETQDWTRKWDGKLNGTPQASGTYVWMLSYTEHDTGKPIFLKGTSVLIR